MNHQSDIHPTTGRGKRVFDLLSAGGLLLIILPLLPLIALVIKLDSPGPVLFRQLRIGRALPDRTELFFMIKFRTMVVDAEKASGAVWAKQRDSRITPVGASCVKADLDELPQLIKCAAWRDVDDRPPAGTPRLLQKARTGDPFLPNAPTASHPASPASPRSAKLRHLY